MIAMGIVTVVTPVDRQQEVTEGPLGDSLSLHPCRGVRETEVDPQKHTCVDHFLGCFRKLSKVRVFWMASGAKGPETVNLRSSRRKNSASVRVTAPVMLFAPEV